MYRLHSKASCLTLSNLLKTCESTRGLRGRSRSRRCGLTAADLASGVHMTKSTGCDRLRTVRARSFLVERWSLETGTFVQVSPMWTRATGREPFAIDREQVANVSCGHGLI